MGVVAPGFSVSNFAKNGWAGHDTFSLAAIPGMFAARRQLWRKKSSAPNKR